MGKAWNVYAKAAIGRTDSLIGYLARYTHRIALSDRRILACRNGKVVLAWRDYRDEGKRKVMELDEQELIRRFLLHVLPPGFKRIRHYGFLANCCRRKQLPVIRAAMARAKAQSGAGEKTAKAPPWPESQMPQRGEVAWQAPRCPECKVGALQPHHVLEASVRRRPLMH